VQGKASINGKDVIEYAAGSQSLAALPAANLVVTK